MAAHAACRTAKDVSGKEGCRRSPSTGCKKDRAQESKGREAMEAEAADGRSVTPKGRASLQGKQAGAAADEIGAEEGGRYTSEQDEEAFEGRSGSLHRSSGGGGAASASSGGERSKARMAARGADEARWHQQTQTMAWCPGSVSPRRMAGQCDMEQNGGKRDGEGSC